MSPEKLNRLGDMLVDAGMITVQQLSKALEYQKANGGVLGHIIEDLGLVKEDILVDFLAKQQGIRIIEPAKVVWPVGLIKKIPRSLIEKYTFLPMHKKDDILTIAISDPTDYEAIEEIQLLTDMRVEVVLAHRSALKKSIQDIFKDEIEQEQATKKIAEKKLLVKKESGRLEAKLDALIGILVSKKIISKEDLEDKTK